MTFFPKTPTKKGTPVPSASGPMIIAPAPDPSAGLKRPMTWVVAGLGLPSNQVPNNLAGQQITPTVEMYRPALRELLQPTDASIAGTNDFVCPVGSWWEFVSLGFRMTASATVGNREIIAAVLLSTPTSFGIVHSVGGNKQQTAGQTFFYSLGAHGVVGDTQVTPGRVLLPAPVGLVIPPGYTLRIQDINGIDTAADSFQLWCLVVKEHPGVQVQ